jgi:hypothetical protein
LHTDLIKMAINDPELRGVWPPIAPGVAETKKDHYCNLILNLQKVAYEAHTIELVELRGALRYLMASREMYGFWKKARAARSGITAGDEDEDFFTGEVDKAFVAVGPPRPGGWGSTLGEWFGERKRSSTSIARRSHLKRRVWSATIRPWFTDDRRRPR